MNQYERERYLYSMLKELPFFQQYRSWKAFVTWRRNVRERKRKLWRPS